MRFNVCKRLDASSSRFLARIPPLWNFVGNFARSFEHLSPSMTVRERTKFGSCELFPRWFISKSLCIRSCFDYVQLIRILLENLAMGKKIDLKSERFGNTSIFLSFEITVRQINFQFGQEVCITITLFSYWHNVESTLLCSLRGQLRPLYSLEIYWKFKLNEIQSKQRLSRIGTRVTTARSINVCCPFEPSFAFNRARVNFPSFFIYFHER